MQELSDVLYEIIDLKKEHSITTEQALILLSIHADITWTASADDTLILINKGLVLPGGKLNSSVVFRVRDPQVGVLELNPESVPNGTEETLALAHKLENTFVLEHWRTPEHRKMIADEYFKGDLTVARYFLIFKGLFPVRDIERNKLWNKAFEIDYTGTTKWDSAIAIAKKFHKEIFLKKDIGIFLSGTYFWVKENINEETEDCYITKPYKYLFSYGEHYELARERIERKALKKAKAEQIVEASQVEDREVSGL